MGLGRKGIKHG